MPQQLSRNFWPVVQPVYELGLGNREGKFLRERTKNTGVSILTVTSVLSFKLQPFHLQDYDIHLSGFHLFHFPNLYLSHLTVSPYETPLSCGEKTTHHSFLEHIRDLRSPGNQVT